MFYYLLIYWAVMQYISNHNIFCFVDVDECDSFPCMNGATCVDNVDSFTCNCQSGYTGDTCQTGMFSI